VGQHPLDIRNKTHVEHSVHFVENENLHLIQVNDSLLHQIKQPAGRGYEYIDPAVQRFDLRALAHAAEDDRIAQM
jgi:hypothetical protein